MDAIDLVVKWAVPFVLGAVVAWVKVSLTKQRDESRAIRGGVRALLYDRIVQGYVHYHDDLGWMPLQAKESMQEVFNNYQKLGGNGLGEQMYKRMQSLPTTKKED
jgi:hypothetical protein